MRTLYVLAAALCLAGYASTVGYLIPNGQMPDATLQIAPKIEIGYGTFLGLAIGYLTCFACTFLGGRRMNLGGVIGAVGGTVFLYYATDIALGNSIGVSLAVVSGFLFEKIFLKPLPSQSSSSN